MFDDGFCGTHSGRGDVCVHSTACSIRSLWRWVGTTLENILDDISLANLASGQVTMPTGFAAATPEETDARSEGAPQ
ncbi:MAG: hypothetical protein JRI25_16310 [Deltaproteobacteria bacterium]|nr:hypothetical protein [Deltaproteobacteria bacterium]